MTTTTDTIVEGDETIVVSMTGVTPVSAPAGSFTVGGPATSTITDNDTVTLSIAPSSPTVAEDGGTVTFTVTASNAVEGGFTVNLGYGGTAEGSDYTGGVASLVFGAADTSKSFTVTTTTDTIVEGDETIVVSMTGVTPVSAPAGSFTVGGPATSTITDNDTVTLSIAPSSPTVAEDGGTVTFTVTANNAVEGGFTVNLGYGGTAEGSDYTGGVASVVFGAADTSKSFTVTTTTDTIVEGDETILSDDALKAMLAYDWPGNVRELENCLETDLRLHQRSANPPHRSAARGC